MRSINKKAAKKLSAILRYEGIEKVGDHAKVQNNSTYMALSVEAIAEWEELFEEPYPSSESPLCISLCHYGLQNGDMMKDPEVCIFRSSIEGEIKYYPYYFRNDYAGVEQRYSCPTPQTEARLQADLCVFVAQWIDNILDQQYDGKVPKGTRAEEEEINAKVAQIKAEQQAALEVIRREEATEESAPMTIEEMAQDIDYEALGNKILEEIERGERQPDKMLELDGYGKVICERDMTPREQVEKAKVEERAKAIEETREERKERLQHAREEREASEKENAKRRDSQVDEPPIKFNTTHRREAIKRTPVKRIKNSWKMRSFA